MSEKKNINNYHGLSKIEDQFRLMEGPLNTRPVFVRTKDHINAHLLICMIALTVMRVIQNKNGEQNDTYWSMGLNGSRIREALNKWQVETITDNYYRFNNLGDEDVK